MATTTTKKLVHVPPLSEKQLRDRAAVVLAYADWWNHLKFKKGWATPLFTFNEVKALLDRAAEIVVRIRAVLDKQDPTFKVRMVDGAAREYFWSLTRKPTEQPERFVRAVVHATFKDGRGYVEGLSEEKVDEFITQFDPALQAHALQALEKQDACLSSIESSWDTTHKVVLEYIKELRTPHSDMPATDASAEEKDCAKLLHQITDLADVVRGYTERAKRRRIVHEDHLAAADGASAGAGAGGVSEGDQHKKNKKKKKKTKAAAGPTRSQDSSNTTATLTDNEQESAPPSASATAAAPATVASPAGPTIEEVPMETESVTTSAQSAGEASASAAGVAVEGEGKGTAQEESASADADANASTSAPAPAETTTSTTTPAAAAATAPPVVSEPEEEESGATGRPDGHVDGEESAVENAEGEEEEEGGHSESESHTSEEPPQNFTIKVQQVAAEVDAISKGVIALSENVRLLDAETLPTDPARASEVLRDLRGRCQHFTDSLLRDMTVLDSLSLPEEHRPVRKAQIQAIERLVDTVEDLTRRIRDMQTRVTEQQRDADAKRSSESSRSSSPPKVASPAPAPAPAAAATTTASHAAAAPGSKGRARVASEEIDEEMAGVWRQLRLQVRLDVDDAGDAYVIQGYVPGLRNEHIKVQLSSDGSSLTVAGTRFPTARETTAMIRQLQREGVEGVEALMRIGAGRFGTFSQQFRLPSNADRERISADYNNNILRVLVPKRQQPRAPVFSSPPTQRLPFGQPRGAMGGGGLGGFPGARPRNMFEDRDFWW